jgi:hypothetical protein
MLVKGAAAFAPSTGSGLWRARGVRSQKPEGRKQERGERLFSLFSFLYSIFSFLFPFGKKRKLVHALSKVPLCTNA